ncbi:MAG: nicotinate-nucleotide adenylyltransferase [Mizugakiibacter sp.]|uniref:nicotinate-nucleotide adenylyltransferase n=1 Tax=Mizugakiibacter sp. TaxID=1972610 RepID=UPI0031BD4041|nr:nicotinate-nucleotide adenylyltransferase [Xanthomonadaceae bacterium]
MSMLAVLGGTFDPVHLGHLRAAWEAAEALDAAVRLMPAHVPPHRPPPLASAAQRVAMLRAALAGQSRLALDTREIERSGPSYMVDTLADLRREVGPARPLVLLLGADAFAGLATWHRWRELFALAHLGVLTRPGALPPLPAELETEVAPRRAGAAAALRAAPAGRVLAIAVTALDISASRVRALLAAGHEPRYLVPDALLADPALLTPYRRAG